MIIKFIIYLVICIILSVMLNTKTRKNYEEIEYVKSEIKRTKKLRDKLAFKEVLDQIGYENLSKEGAKAYRTNKIDIDKMLKQECNRHKKLFLKYELAERRRK